MYFAACSLTPPLSQAPGNRSTALRQRIRRTAAAADISPEPAAGAAHWPACPTTASPRPPPSSASATTPCAAGSTPAASRPTATTTAGSASAAPTSPRWRASWPTPGRPGLSDGRRAASVSARNRMRGVVTRVVHDSVMAQVEMVCGPYRVVSLMSSEAAARAGARPRRHRGRLGQVDQRRGGAAVRRAAVTTAAARLALLATLAALRCGDDAAAPSRRRRTTLDVLAASSLTESFERPGRGLRGRQPRCRPCGSSLGSSSALAQQVTEGAPADVLATADLAEHGAGRRRRGATPPSFATNELVLVTPADNPAGITSLDDLDRRPVRHLRRVRPLRGAGRPAAARATTSTAEPVSREADVKAVLAKVVLRRGRRRPRLRHRRRRGRRRGRHRRGARARPTLPARYAVATVTASERAGARRRRGSTW